MGGIMKVYLHNTVLLSSGASGLMELVGTSVVR